MLKVIWLNAKLLQLSEGQPVAHLCQLCLQMEHMGTFQLRDTEALLSARCCPIRSESPSESGLLQR